MSGSESLRGNVPAALEELRNPRSGGCLVWFFELLWAYSPESRGLIGTDQEPGLMMSNENNNSKNQQSKTSDNEMNKYGPQPDLLWRSKHGHNDSHTLAGTTTATTTTANNNNNNILNNMQNFGMLDESAEDGELNSLSPPGHPHDDFLWLPVLPPTVLLNFSRIQSWYFSPKSRMQMQREVAFYSVADEDDAKRMYQQQQLQQRLNNLNYVDGSSFNDGENINNNNGNDNSGGDGLGGGANSSSNGKKNKNNNNSSSTISNDIDKLLMKYHQRERENKKVRDSIVKSKFQGGANSKKNIKNNNNTESSSSVFMKSNGAVTSNESPANLNSSNQLASSSENNNNNHNKKDFIPSSTSTMIITTTPEAHQLTLVQRQCLGVRSIAERYKREHSSNGDELPAPVLKRLRGRLSTAVIVDAFERDYSQGLRVENMTSHGLAMQQVAKDKNNSNNNVNSMLTMMMDDEDDSKKKRKINIRHYPVGWVCPEGPEQQQLQYDRIVAQLIRKSADVSISSSSQSHHQNNSYNASSFSKRNNSRGSYNNKNSNFEDNEDDENKNDDDAEFGNHNSFHNLSNSSSTAKRSGGTTFSTLPSAARTAELLSQSLSSPSVEYLTMESLRRVLCNGTLGQAALLQQFVPPPPPSAIGNARYNETLDFRWQPHWRYLERCTNAHPLDDYTVPANKRGPTFEGVPGSSQGAMLAQATLYRLERACRAIVRHVFVVSQHTARILRLHCIFKFDDKLTLVLLCAVEAYAINPRAIPPATTIANILNADAHLPRMRTALAQQKQQEQLLQLQQAQQQHALILKQQQQQIEYQNWSKNKNQQQQQQQRGVNNNNNSSSATPHNHHHGEDASNASPPRSPASSITQHPSGSYNISIDDTNNINKQSMVMTREERKNYLQLRAQQNAMMMVTASSIGEQVTATGWEAIALDPDDVRRSPIRALAAMSRGEARSASIRQTMRERVGAVELKKEMKMIMDTQGVVKPLEQLRKEADAAFAAINPKAAKQLDALFSRREKRRALMRANNSSAFDDENNKATNYLRPSSVSAKYSTKNNNNENNDNDDDDEDGSSSSFPHHQGQGSGANAVTKIKKMRRANNTTQFTEASETIDDLLWGRQSQLARALLRPVASREDAKTLPFHRRPARSLAAECGASGVGDRYIKTMRSVSTPEPSSVVGSNSTNALVIQNHSKPEVQHRRAFF